MKALRLKHLSLLILLFAHFTGALAATPLQKAWEILETGANEKSVSKRAQAVSMLGLLPGDPKAVEMAEKALEDEKSDVRAAAATALGEMKSKASIPKLQRAINDKEISVVLASAHSLLALKENKAYGVYYAVLTGKHKAGESLLAQEQKMFQDPKAVAEFGFEQGIGFIPFAGMGYGALKQLTKDDTSPIRAAAAKVLANDHDPRSGEALARAVLDKHWIVRAAALNAIAMRDDPSLIEDIQPALSDQKEIVRFAAAAAVIRLTKAVKIHKGSK